jgi:hypothetical protein
MTITYRITDIKIYNLSNGGDPYLTVDNEKAYPFPSGLTISCGFSGLPSGSLSLSPHEQAIQTIRPLVQGQAAVAASVHGDIS